MKKIFKIAIASGKGGVGKSMLASSLSILYSQTNKKVIACDCDVDAPNLAIWLGEPEQWSTIEKISTVEKPRFNWKKCNNCGLCVKACQFGALKMKGKRHQFNPFLCEGCGVCQLVCPNGAIKLTPVHNGAIKIKKTKYGFPLISGQLFPGESNSGKIVTEVKKQAEKFSYDLMIIDSPPGTGCPVIASLQDVDLAVLITEPTPSGISDLKRVLQLIKHFNIAYGLVINKWDINKKLTKKIEKEFKGKILGKILYNQNIFKSIADLTPIVETGLNTKNEIEKIFKTITKL